MNVFPVTPYTVYAETSYGPVTLDFDATQWHLPAAVKITGSNRAVESLKRHFNAYPYGMWGYPIEQLEYCSPMDIHANLVANENYYHDPDILRFDVVGYVPDELPDSIHPNNYDPDEDDDGEDE